MISLEAQTLALRNKVDRNLRFGIARGLTETAKEAAKAIEADMPRIFDRPTAFTQRGIGFAPANKTTLTARVFVRDMQAKYLMRQERGGIRTPEPGSPITLPVKQRLNQHGNLGRGTIARLRAKPNVFAVNGKGKTAHLPPGIYERLGTRKARGLGSSRGRKATAGRGGQKSRVKLLVAFEPKAKYQPRFQFVVRTKRIASATVKRNIEASIAEAMRTAR